MNNLEERLRTLEIEDFIWIIYIGIIILSFYSNNLERDYLINDSIDSKNRYRFILFIIFVILVIIYLYNVVDNIKNLDLNNKYQYMSLIASIFILISGIIYLIIIIKDEEINVEIAFN